MPGLWYINIHFQNGENCLCGNETYNKYGECTETSANSYTSCACDKPCTGNNQAMCGGALANSVYKAG